MITTAPVVVWSVQTKRQEQSQTLSSIRKGRVLFQGWGMSIEIPVPENDVC